MLTPKMNPYKLAIPCGAGITQLVECKLPKLDVAGSSPVSRSKKIMKITGNLKAGCPFFLFYVLNKPNRCNFLRPKEF